MAPRPSTNNEIWQKFWKLKHMIESRCSFGELFQVDYQLNICCLKDWGLKTQNANFVEKHMNPMSTYSLSAECLRQFGLNIAGGSEHTCST